MVTESLKTNVRVYLLGGEGNLEDATFGVGHMSLDIGLVNRDVSSKNPTFKSVPAECPSGVSCKRVALA